MYEMESLEETIDQLIEKNGIILRYDDWEESDPDVIMVRQTKTIIIINRNFETPYPIVFRKAHEVSHFLFGTLTDNTLYEFSDQLRYREEIIANQGAISILAKILFSEMPMVYRNWLNFMNEFALPYSFELMVKEVIKSV